MSSWDVFHGDRLEVERGLDAGAVRDAFSRGELRPDDLIRPAGTTIAWARLAQFPELIASQVPAPELTLPPPPVAASPAPAKIRKQKQVADTELQASPKTAGREARPSGAGAGRAVAPAVSLNPRGEDEVGGLSDVTFPVINDQPAMKTPVAVQSKSFEPPPPGGWLWAEEVDDEEESDGDFDRPGAGGGAAASAAAVAAADGLEILDDDEEAAPPPRRTADLSFDDRPSVVALPAVEPPGWAEPEEEEIDLSFSRGGPETVEELDLAPMVDVAFQLVLFFMVTATTVLYKTLEIPKPSKEQAPTAVTQGRSLSDLQDDFILVEIDPTGGIKIDHEPIAANMNTLVERLRQARETTGRKSMLLSADFVTKHRDTVLAIDAAHEIGMNIVIARPAGPIGPAPTLLSQPRVAGPPAAPAAAAPAAPAAGGAPPF